MMQGEHHFTLKDGKPYASTCQDFPYNLSNLKNDFKLLLVTSLYCMLDGHGICRTDD